MASLPPIDEERVEEELFFEQDDGPSDGSTIRQWRGQAKRNHTLALQAASSALLTAANRDYMLVSRQNIVKCYEVVSHRHDWLLSHVWLTSAEREIETAWLKEVTDNHYQGINAIDVYLRSIPAPKSKTSSRHSQSSGRSSTSSTRARIIEADRAEREAELKLRQISEENDKRMREDELLVEKRLEQQKTLLQIEIEEKRVQDERTRRSAEADLERQRMNANLLRQDLRGEFDDEEPTTETPLPSMDQLGRMPGNTTESPVEFKSGRQTPTIGTQWPSQTSIPFSDKPVKPTSMFTAFLNKTIFALTPRKTPIPTGSLFNRMPASQNGPAPSERFALGSSSEPPFQRVFTPIPAVTTNVTTNQPAGGTIQQMVARPSKMDESAATKKELGARPRVHSSSSAAPHPIRETPNEHVALSSVPPEGKAATIKSKQDARTTPPQPTPVFQPCQHEVSFVQPADQGQWTGQNQPVTSAPNPYPTQPVTTYSQLHFTGRQTAQNQHTGWSGQPGGAQLMQAPQQTDQYSPDEWIRNLGLNMPASSSVRGYIRPPRMELQKFDGDQRKWPMFIQSFKIQVHDAVDNDAVRLTHLRNSLSSEIQSHIGEALINPGLYQFALLELQRKFGNPQIVAQACTSALLTLKPFKDNDYPSLKLFASTLHSVVATLNQSGYGAELRSSATLFQLVSKLPPILKSKWGEVSWSWQPNLPTVVDFDCWLDNVSMAEYALRAGLPKQPDQAEKSGNNSRKPNPDTKARFSGSSTTTPTKTGSCANCEGNHKIDFCHKFKAMTVEDRSEILVKKRLCYRCLAKGHFSADCKRVERCSLNGCKARHHPLMHGAPKLFPPSTTQQPVKGTTMKMPPTNSEKKSDVPPASQDPFSGSTTYSQGNSGTLLPIVPVRIKYGDGVVDTYALLDIGSQITMIKSWVTDDLQMERCSAVRMGFGTVNGVTPSKLRDSVNFVIASVEDDVSFDIEGALIVDSFNLTQQSINLKRLFTEWPHLKDIPLKPNPSKEVSLIIGLDYPALHTVVDHRTDRLDHRAPRAICTMFGWCITGPVSPPESMSSSPVCVYSTTISQSTEDNLDHLVREFLQADMIGVNPHSKPPIDPDEQRAINILESTVRHTGERYEAGTLWKEGHPCLPDNETAAMARLISLERRWKTDPALGKAYDEGIKEYVRLGYARKLTPEEAAYKPSGKTWFLAHHPVTNPNKPGFRIVHDGSFTFKGHSLNLACLKGPDYIPRAPGMLFRFREKIWAIIADIRKMYYQVLIRDEDRSAFRFLWREPGSVATPDTYGMNVHIFGSISSPAVCMYVLRQAAKDSGEHAEKVLREVTDHFYVDNWLVSYDTEEEAIESAQIMYEALLKGGFELTQWASSSPLVQGSLPGQTNQSVNLDLDAVPVERTLGLRWNYREDLFILSVNVDHTPSTTKRQLLRIVSSIFDPLGFLSAVIFTAKSLLQDVWRTACGWDEDVEETILARWKEWLDTLPCLQTLMIPRCYFPNRFHSKSTHLHIFADASELGFGSVAYLRREYENEIVTSFVFAKSRVAPLKFVTMPRMELCAAVTAIRIALFIAAESRIHIDRTVFWSDSTTVLSWINSTSSRFHVYVGNRLGEILDSSKPDQWCYIPSAENPADDLSRGLAASDLSPEHRWLTGPTFLRQSEEEWPKSPLLPKIEAEDPEVRNISWAASSVRLSDPFDMLVQKTSRVDHLYRVCAYVLRWIKNLKGPAHRISGELTVAEIQAARTFLLTRIQRDAYPDELEDLLSGKFIEKTSSLIKLTPFLDSDGLMRVGGRLEHAPLPFGARHPIILPPKSHLTSIIVWKVHVERAHPSADQTLQELRSLYWIPKGRTTVQRIINRCVPCKRYNSKPLNPIMANLPAFRLQPGLPAFARTGVDYFGPLEVRILRSNVKRWGCLFTCLSSRAVHLEMAFSLDTDSFLSCLTRFEARYGTPMSYHSDNGTNFVGAKNELTESLRNFDQAAIAGNLCRRNAQWFFNPPAAPHFGGVWERLVRSAKRALLHILNGRTLTDEILITALALVSNLLNSRPITAVGDDPRNPEPLTPHHLLLGRANPNLPPDVFTTKDLSSKKRWRQTQVLIDHFWNRWVKEFVPSLIERQKWTGNQRNLRVNDIVMILDKNQSRGSWPIGRVESVITGPDGIVRSAVIWTEGTQLHRPAVDLCLLEAESTDIDSASHDGPVFNEPRAGDVAESSVVLA